ncbi:putative signal peptide protein [Puccinia sorghi]|uniref:Putative signal peptide protein n=1 Tax=Puccinia sorghi TaxID=27349 RepID=A0A0L6V3I2_9BASI|nr:putative signal peptide protein [Puccinia sorghi]
MVLYLSFYFLVGSKIGAYAVQFMKKHRFKNTDLVIPDFLAKGAPPGHSIIFFLNNMSSLKHILLIYGFFCLYFKPTDPKSGLEHLGLGGIDDKLLKLLLSNNLSDLSLEQATSLIILGDIYMLLWLRKGSMGILFPHVKKKKKNHHGFSRSICFELKPCMVFLGLCNHGCRDLLGASDGKGFSYPVFQLLLMGQYFFWTSVQEYCNPRCVFISHNTWLDEEGEKFLIWRSIIYSQEENFQFFFSAICMKIGGSKGYAKYDDCVKPCPLFGTITDGFRRQKKNLGRRCTYRKLETIFARSSWQALELIDYFSKLILQGDKVSDGETNTILADLLFENNLHSKILIIGYTEALKTHNPSLSTPTSFQFQLSSINSPTIQQPFFIYPKPSHFLKNSTLGSDVLRTVQFPCMSRFHKEERAGQLRRGKVKTKLTQIAGIPSKDPGPQVRVWLGI